MRLDIYLSENFDIQSRNKAQEFIKANKVKINGKTISKPSYKVENSDNIELLEEEFYVSRAAYKLKHFLFEIQLNLKDKAALDIGSSTGGFTQVLIENDIDSVDCVDVGSNQLHESLREKPQISFYENCDIRNFVSKKWYDIITCDVSFISMHNILTAIDMLANDGIIILFKPQFEVGMNIKRD